MAMVAAPQTSQGEVFHAQKGRFAHRSPDIDDRDDRRPPGGATAGRPEAGFRVRNPGSTVGLVVHPVSSGGGWLSILLPGAHSTHGGAVKSTWELDGSHLDPNGGEH